MTNPATGSYGMLGGLLLYPDESFSERLAACSRRLLELDPASGREVRRFAAGIDGLSLERLQELFTRTFDLNPVCSLEVGWQLYGEEYTRGTFLVAMRGMLREHGVAESGELPDHLTHVLPLLDRMVGSERNHFNDKYLNPALGRMLKAFEGKGDSPYLHVLRACERHLLCAEASESAEVSSE